MARNKNVVKSEFFCTKCGKQGIPIARREGKAREPGHLKKLFCLHCQEEINHVEIRPFGSYIYEDFLEEYSLGRFFEGKRLHVMNLMSCSKTDCLYNKHGKCWNSNYSYKCSYRPHKTKEEIGEMYKNAEL